jgi:FKBP-type peptidyl-prolyl cis-trans isomerase FklB
MVVRRMSLLAVGVVLVGLVAWAQEPLPNRQPKPTQPAAPPKVTKEQMSYAIGLNAGMELSSSGVDVDPAMVVQGINDALKRAKPQLTNEQIGAALDQFQQAAYAAAMARFKAIGEQSKKDGPVFLAENKKKQGVTTLPSGLQVQVLKQGTGQQQPKKTDYVQVHYTGTFTDGKVFESTEGNREPMVFPVTKVIPGWTEALLRMKVGDKWRLTIPPELAYGAEGQFPSIPPNAVLIYDVELVAIGPPQP